MITPGMYSAAKGMLGYIEQNDVIANNIANVNTAGYKNSALVFKNLYNTMVEQTDRTQNPKYREIEQVGEISMGSGVQQLVHEFSQGNLMRTDNPLDVAIQGDGFFKVRSADGKISYTRNGAFMINNRNQLVTEEGDNVLDVENRPIVINVNELNLRSYKDINITDAGQIEINHEENKITLQTIGVFDFQDKEFVNWEGGAKFVPTDPQYNPELKAEKFTIQQGAIETSNTNLVSEMIGMIKVSRGYETLSKFMKEQSSMLSTAINVGRPNF